MGIAGDIDQIFIRTFLFSTIGAGAYLFARLRFRWRSRRAKDWPLIKATIQTTAVEQLPRNVGIQVSLGYSYFVDEYRSGEHLTVFANDEEAYDFERYVKNQDILVRYNPRNPDRSVIEETSLAKAFERGMEVDVGHESINGLSFDRVEYVERPKS